MKRFLASFFVLALFILLVGCGGGSGGGSSTSGGSTSGSTGAIAGHLDYIVGVAAQDHVPSPAPQDVVLLLQGTGNQVTLKNAIVTDSLLAGDTYTFLDAGSKPINGTRSSSTMSVIVGSTTYSVPLDADGATTRPVFAYGMIYPVSAIGNLTFPNGIQV